MPKCLQNSEMISAAPDTMFDFIFIRPFLANPGNTATGVSEAATGDGLGLCFQISIASYTAVLA
jgi:hypothetical protein